MSVHPKPVRPRQIAAYLCPKCGPLILAFVFVGERTSWCRFCNTEYRLDWSEWPERGGES